LPPPSKSWPRSQALHTSKEIAQVRFDLGNSDASIGERIAEAMAKVGKEGVITVERRQVADDELDIVEGMQFEPRYLSPYFITIRTSKSQIQDKSVHPAVRQEDLQHPRPAAYP